MKNHYCAPSSTLYTDCSIFYMGVLRCQARVRCNAHQVDRVVVSQASSQVEVESLGSGLYPLLPLLNHSCDHNTLRLFRNNQVVLLAAR